MTEIKNNARELIARAVLDWVPRKNGTDGMVDLLDSLAKMTADERHDIRLSAFVIEQQMRLLQRRTVFTSQEYIDAGRDAMAEALKASED